MHEDGKITIYLANFNYPTLDLRISKIMEILDHETLHKAIHVCIDEGDLEWANQEFIINRLLAKS
jgi:uncharacterized ubiquitin-like protein YukD